jgi:hypothetical protein
MKITHLFILAALGLCLFTGCAKSKDDTASPSTTNAAAFSVDGKWVISSYTQRGEDKSRPFSGYSFTFATTGTNSGSIVSVKDNTSFTGSWTHQPAVTYYGSSSKESMTLNFGPTAPVSSLNKIWNIVSVTNTQLSLVSPEVAEQENLVFTKQ